MIGGILGAIFMVGGFFFCTVGVLGIVRFPDVYTRIHASGKVSSLGVTGILIGTAFFMPDTALELIVLGIFLVISSPVASHAIALAAYRQGVPRAGIIRDDLADRKSSIE